LSEGQETPNSGSSVLRNVVLVVAAIYVAASLWISATQHELKSQTGALASQVGLTQKQLDQRAAELQRQQRQAVNAIEATKQEQAQTKQQLGAVAGELSGVKGEVGGVKTDVASTKTDLEATKQRLDKTIGDLGVASGLIARTRDDLETLRRKGDRTYYEFQIRKSKQPTRVGDVSLRVKKTDPKRSKYTLEVIADDRTVEKKDRGLNEPLQFYSGREKELHEVVVNSVEKDMISGYLSTPKKY
jgi:chromosome segregation ATPase